MWPVVHLANPIKRKPMSPPLVAKLTIPDLEGAPWRMRHTDVGALGRPYQASAPKPPPKESLYGRPLGLKLSGTLANVSSLSLPSTARAETPTSASDPWGTPWNTAEPFRDEQRRPSEPTTSSSRGRTVRRWGDDAPSPLSRALETNPSGKGNPWSNLPSGFKAVDCPSHLEREDITKLHQQAVGQVARFEVLGVKDVEHLSRVSKATMWWGRGEGDHRVPLCKSSLSRT